MPLLAQKGARNDTPDVIRPDQLKSRFAQCIQALQSEVLFMGCDLEHRVGRGVENRLAAGHMFVAQPLDDLDAGGVTVAQKTRHTGVCLQGIGQLLREGRDLARKVTPVKINRQSGNLPVATLRVLTSGALAGCAIGRAKIAALIEALRPLPTGQLRGRAQSHCLQIRQLQTRPGARSPGGDMTQGIGPCITESRCIRRGTQTQGIKQQDESSWHAGVPDQPGSQCAAGVAGHPARSARKTRSKAIRSLAPSAAYFSVCSCDRSAVPSPSARLVTTETARTFKPQ